MKKLYKKEKGYSLMEVLVSATIFSVAALGVAKAYVTQTAFNTLSDQTSGAVLAAQEVLDEIRVSDVSQLPMSGSEEFPVTIGNRRFDVNAIFCIDDQYCEESSARHITVRVTLNQEQRYEVETIFTQLRGT